MKVHLNDFNRKERITTALLLAAGTGSRLYPLTQNSPKCLTLVNEKSILERLVIVTGHQENCIREFLGTNYEGIKIEYIFSKLYKTTNNIYSLWMAREIIDEPFVLIESDIVFDLSLLDKMCYPDMMAVALMQNWMNGTTVTIDQNNSVTEFQKGTTETYQDVRYKTVNIYSFSTLAWQAVIKKLDNYISSGFVSNYYETVFEEMVADGSLNFKTVSFDNKPWYEIDTLDDLAEAEKLFPLEITKTEILNKFISQSPELSDNEPMNSKNKNPKIAIV